jgi:hypothetical protein
MKCEERSQQLWKLKSLRLLIIGRGSDAIGPVTEIDTGDIALTRDRPQTPHFVERLPAIASLMAGISAP